MSPKSPVVLQLLKRLDLPSTANKAQIRAAYLRKVKVLHPDVAGKSAEERFRQLKDEYEHAMELMQKGPHAHHPHRSHPRHGHSHDFHSAQASHHSHQRHRRHWDPNPWPSTSGGLSFAERLRNSTLISLGVFGTAVYWLKPSPDFAMAPPSPRFDDSKQREADLQRAEAAAKTLARGEGAAPYIREKSDYYKSRLTRGTVRVRGTDSYVSPAEAAKSREKREGTQYTNSKEVPAPPTT
ncbi:unnamed protein product [Durusdinium trenchii]|uniref:J domain-containing protein n=1 Tax=Durusdinium trenchii TaxID=1381693 RepID=A0ABP0HH61_9DINO